MSGIEIVGLVLGAFPLIISALESYERGYQGVKDWIYFRREFTTLVNELKREQILFCQQIEGILRSITDSDFDMKGMVDNPQDIRWKEGSLVLKMMERFSGPGEFESYNASIQSIYNDLNGMMRKLESCGPPKPDASSDTTQRKFFLQQKLRKLRFSLRKKRWQDQVHDIGRQIDRVGKLLGEAEALAPARFSRTTDAVQVFVKTKAQASNLHGAIDGGWTCKCEHGHASKLIIDPMDSKSTLQSGSRVLRVAFPLRPRAWRNALTTLHQDDDWYVSETTMVSKAVAFQNLEWAADVTEGTYSESLTSDLTKLTSATTAMTSPPTSPPLLPEKQPLRDSQPWPGQSPPPDLVERLSKITDLCQSMREPISDANLRYLEDKNGLVHILNPSSTLNLDSAEIERIVNLSTILDPASQRQFSFKLSRRERLSIALNVAHALLELCPTPWFPTHWSKADIYFFQKKTGELVTDAPFLLCQTDDMRVLGPAEADHTDALLSLGILVMELWFGEAIETRTLWRAHCDANANEPKLTSLSAAIEWQKEAKNEGGVTLHDITHRCIRGNFGLTSLDLQKADCVAAVHDGVVVPLKSVLSYFWPVQRK